ncbi:MAG: hypothetical protein COV73_00600 [Candidatus Omnitrophica bacterium CG11_big_fil_rev_8_21_14_0_20_43_6]|nr:MAG: hypothetical protein COV73_00600 [Candidatus Omnitrophica bacterium CG11_big_fil_rev_8_21_14_0_20_43_6]
MLKYWIIFTAALTASVVFTSLLTKIFLKYNVFKTKNIPLAGGLGIGLAFIFSLVLSFFMFDLFASRVLIVAEVCLIILFLGLLDDLRELTVVQKLLGQSVCAILLISSGVRTEIVYLGTWGNILVTFFGILGLTNAFNLLDIMDGLAAGIALIVSGAFLVIGFLSADLNVQVLSLILCAASAGFLIFNLPPARAYLGNSGSHFLGMLIACIVLITHYASMDNAFALFSPLMILGLPIIDTVLLVIFRVIKRKPPFKKSKDHLALRIGALGASPFKTILIMYLLCAIFASCGVVLTKVNNFFAVIIVYSVFILGTTIFLKLIKVEVDD